MKLYYSPGACSLSPHIVLREAGLAVRAVLASTKTHKLQDGTDFYTINPKATCRVLELDNGERLTEGPAIVQYIADQAPAKKPRAGRRHDGALPPAGVAQLHRPARSTRAYGPLFNPAMPEESKSDAPRPSWPTRYSWVDAQLEGKSFLLGDSFSVADAYLFTVTNWAKHVGIDISALQEPRRLHGPGGRASRGPGGDEGRRPAQVGDAMRRSAALLALLAAGAAAGATPAAPGRYDAELCVATRPQAAPTCGAAEVEVAHGARSASASPTSSIASPSAAAARGGDARHDADRRVQRRPTSGRATTLRFSDQAKDVRYEVRIGARRIPRARSRVLPRPRGRGPARRRGARAATADEAAGQVRRREQLPRVGLAR